MGVHTHKHKLKDFWSEPNRKKYMKLHNLRPVKLCNIKKGRTNKHLKTNCFSLACGRVDGVRGVGVSLKTPKWWVSESFWLKNLQDRETTLDGIVRWTLDWSKHKNFRWRQNESKEGSKINNSSHIFTHLVCKIQNNSFKKYRI